MCQLQSLREWDYRNLPLKRLYDSRIRILWSAKLHLKYLLNRAVFALKNKRWKDGTRGGGDVAGLRPGDAVRVASRKEIDETLDPWGAVNGCVFLREMYRYCGGTYKVLKTAEYFYDEKRGRLVRCSGLVILDGLVCGGERRLFREPCDRYCFLFWRAELDPENSEAGEANKRLRSSSSQKFLIPPVPSSSPGKVFNDVS